VEKWEKGSYRSRTIQQLLEIMLTTKSSLVILYVTLFRTIGGLHKVKAFFPVFFNGSPIKLQSKDKWSLLLMSKPSRPIIINESPKALVSRGMEAFRQGDIDGSIFFFDAADEKTEGKLNPYLWQRGLSYYYADRFQEGSKQVCSKSNYIIVFFTQIIMFLLIVQNRCCSESYGMLGKISKNIRMIFELIISYSLRTLKK